MHGTLFYTNNKYRQLRYKVIKVEIWKSNGRSGAEGGHPIQDGRDFGLL
jgi:hypothetical protein